MTITALSAAARPARPKTLVLWVACGAHALHDGLTDALYVLLPLRQVQFALNYAAVGVLRALYAGAMAGFQVPVAAAARRIGGPRILAAGTAAAGVAYLFFGASSSVVMLAIALILGGIGSSTQHPIASSVVLAAVSQRLQERTSPIGMLRVSALPTFAMRWLIPRLPEFQRDYPDLELRIVTASSPDEQFLMDVDAVISGPSRQPGWVAKRFLTEARLPVLAPG